MNNGKDILYLKNGQFFVNVQLSTFTAFDSFLFLYKDAFVDLTILINIRIISAISANKEWLSEVDKYSESL